MNRPKKMNKTESYYWGLHDGVVKFIHENECNYFKMWGNAEAINNFLKNYNDEQPHLKRPKIKRDDEFLTIFFGQLKRELAREGKYNQDTFVKFAENFGVTYYFHTPFSDSIIKALRY